MNRNRRAAFITGTALGVVAIFAAPIAAQAAPISPAPATQTHTTIAGWAHNLPGGIPVPIHGNSVTRHLTVAPGGVRTVEVNDFTCQTVGGHFSCKTHVLETLKTNANGKLTVTLPVHKSLDNYAIYVKGTKQASSAETNYWGVYKA